MDDQLTKAVKSGRRTSVVIGVCAWMFGVASLLCLAATVGAVIADGWVGLVVLMPAAVTGLGASWCRWMADDLTSQADEIERRHG